MDRRVKEMLDACGAFIDSATPEELIEYEKSLGLDYSKYSSGIEFSKYIDLNFSMSMIDSIKYSSNVSNAINQPVFNSFCALAY